MKNIIGISRYLSLVAVLTLLLAFLLATLWSVGRAVVAATEIILSYGQGSSISLLLIKTVDAFLISIVLYILAASIYSLFIDDPGLPSRLVARDLWELKSKLSGVVVLVLAVRFAELLFEGTVQAQDILWLGLAIAAVAGVLIVFIRLAPEHESAAGRKG